MSPEERSVPRKADRDPKHDQLLLAGGLLLRLMQKTMKSPEVTGAQVWDLYLRNARSHLEATAISEENRHAYLALKTSLDLCERVRNGASIGPEALKSELALFHSSVETVLGGPRALDIGGRRATRHRLTTKSYHQRAALVCLWESFPEDRPQLLEEARKILGVNSKQQVTKIVENHHQRHDFDLSKSRSPLSIHMKFIKELIKECNFRRLSDFI